MRLDMSGAICRDCQADIIWGRTTAGKMMPLDPERLDRDDESANVAVCRDHLGRVLARVLTADEQPLPHEWRAMPHFATCLPRLAAQDRVEGVVSLDRKRRAVGR